MTRLAVTLALILTAATASAQTRRPSPPTTSSDPLSIRGFGDVGVTAFTAAKSFEALFGSRSGAVFGGGVEIGLRRGLFVGVRASRFRRDGQRVFVFDGRPVSLQVDTTVTIMPIEITGGYRFNRGSPVVPYVGGGVGWHLYDETAPSAVGDENVHETFTGFQLMGGAEFPFHRFLAVAGEAQWATVRDALGQDPNSVARAFDESDLGGFTLRVKVVFGR